MLTCNSAATAIELFRSETIDLVIVDYYMPGMNGLSLAHELRQTKRVPIMVLSAFVELPGETIGTADVWVTKGVTSEELLSQLEELLSDSNVPPASAAGGAS